MVCGGSPERCPPAPVIDIGDIERALAVATDPAEIKEINADAFEQYTHDGGLYSIEDMRPINELRMRARWKLSSALVAVERKPGTRTDRTPLPAATRLFTSFLNAIGLDRKTAMVTQRIATMPDTELERAKSLT